MYLCRCLVLVMTQTSVKLTKTDLLNKTITQEAFSHLAVIVLDVGCGAMRPALKVGLPCGRHREEQLLVHRPTVGGHAREQELVGEPDGVAVQRHSGRALLRG